MGEIQKFVESKVVMMPVGNLKTGKPFCDVFEIKETDLNQVIEAIRQKGFDTLYPIVIWEGHDNIVVDGHTRLTAAKELGFTDVPVVSRSFVDEEAALEHTIAAQRIRRALSQAELMKCVAVMHEKISSCQEESRVKGLTQASGRTTQRIADVIGSTRGTVDKIERITRHGDPSLVQAVKEDEITINQAHEIVKEAERKKRGIEKIEKMMEKNKPTHRERFLQIKDFGKQISCLYEEFLKSNRDLFCGDEIESFFWGDLRKELRMRLDRDLICHLGKPGAADNAIEFTKNFSGFDEDLDCYYESLQEEGENSHAIAE